MRNCLLILFLAFCLVLLLGCSPVVDTHPRITNDMQLPLEQCELPIMWSMSNNMPERFYNMVQEAFVYWDDLTPRRLFFEAGTVEFDPSSPAGLSLGTVGLFTVGMGFLPAHTNAIAQTHLTWYGQNSTCFSGFSITIYVNPDEEQPLMMQSALRHEVGHVLGFGHSSQVAALMFPSRLPIPNPVIELSEQELVLFQSIYGKGERN